METIEREGIFIRAERIQLGENVRFGTGIYVDVRGSFELGDHSRLGDDVRIEGRNVIIGKYFYHSSGLVAGLNRGNFPDANLTVGDRCTFHNNHIDLVREVIIGNDVGLSPDVTIYTHGYWLSVLDGFPAKHLPVVIKDGVIVGYRTTIVPGVTIGSKAVIGAQSVVVGDVESQCVYTGNPARKVRIVTKPMEIERRKMMAIIMEEYKRLMEYRGLTASISYHHPFVMIDGCSFNVDEQTHFGNETEITDDFRDFVFRYGLRFYSPRPFKSLWRRA